MNSPTNQVDWRSARAICVEIGTLAKQEKLALCTALMRICNGVLYAPDYVADKRWSSILVLSDSGKECLKLLRERISTDLSLPDAYMAVFRKLFHHDLLIDFQQSDLAEIEAILCDELMNGRLRLPHRFGRLLYEKFNKEYSGNRTGHLLAEDAWRLTEGSPVGVYQLGRVLVGPLGILKCDAIRYIPPQRKVLLWHCSDPGCRTAHSVELLAHDVPVVKILSALREVLVARYGPASEWTLGLSDLLGMNLSPQSFSYHDISMLVADCVLNSERTALVVSALNGAKGAVIRSVLGSPPRKKSQSQGAAESVAGKLSQEEQLQLLLTLTDNELVTLLDKCVRGGVLNVPIAETRAIRNKYSFLDNEPASELSSLGVRCAHKEPLLDFCGLLWKAYQASSRVDDLNWRLHNTSGQSSQSALLEYLSRNPPTEAVKELVLGSETITKLVCEEVGCSIEDVTEQKFHERLLWKLGFELPQFSEQLPLLRRRLEQFNHELLDVEALKTEADRERIRSVGVNLFVSIEVFLDQLVSYNVWLLSSDHFLNTRFRYSEDSARAAVARVLGGSIGSGEESVAWQSDRTNTLGVSMAYLVATSSWLKRVLDQPREEYRRPDSDLPHFAEQYLRIFPFRHTALWADSDRSALERYADGFHTVTVKLARSNLAAIRNGIDHHRGEQAFPKINEMLAFVSHLRESIEYVDANRFLPKEFWLDEVRQDRFGRKTFVLKDYKNRSFTYYGPSSVVSIPGVGLRNPAIIAPGNLLGTANAEIIFTPLGQSVYSDYWNGYPKRRRIPHAEKTPVSGEIPDGQTDAGASFQDEASDTKALDSQGGVNELTKNDPLPPVKNR